MIFFHSVTLTEIVWNGRWGGVLLEALHKFLGDEGFYELFGGSGPNDTLSIPAIR